MVKLSPLKKGAKKHNTMEIVAKQTKLTMMQQLEDIIVDVSWGRLSQEYFGKSSSWMYNKLHGRDGNGGVGEFTPAEKEQLQGALYDIADRIRKAASTITQ